MKRWMAASVAMVLALILIRTAPVRVADDKNCAPLICQSLDWFYDMPLWLYFGCDRPPCEAGGL